MTDKKTTQRSDSNIRHILAIGITSIGIIGVVVLASVIVTSTADAPKAQLVFTAVLPLIGTWVGTVLAYYFSKENLEAATRTVTAIAGQLSSDDKLRSRAVKVVMIPRAQMFVVRGPATQVNLVQALASLEKAGKGDRIPVLDPNDVPVCVVHRSLVDRFISIQARSTTPPVLNNLTLQDMLADAAFKAVIDKSFSTVNENATLADAKVAMDAITTCLDIFVTRAGTRNEAVIGWITNAVIEDNARV